jgi:ABC-type nitrate/sulfonate/bicarbonate transport system ATPase subunit
MAVGEKLALIDVSKSYPSDSGEPFFAIRDVSLVVPDQQFVSLLGPSGSGKTTLLKIAAGLIQPSAGRILLNGCPITGPGRKCGFVPQAYTLFPWLTVERNIEFGLRLSPASGPRRAEVVADMLNLVGLGRYRGFYPKALSGGMQQRVAIARTLAVDPEVLLMDEPFGALDSQTRSAMQENLLSVWAKKRKTVLFVTHDVEEAIFLSDVIYVSSKLPGPITDRLEIPFGRPRDYALKQTVEFHYLKNSVMDILRKDHAAGGSSHH